MSVDAVPPGLKLEEISAFLQQQPGDRAVHDLHVWSMSTTEFALTCHCSMLGGQPGDEALARLALDLKNRFKFDHSTIQVEIDENSVCVLEPDHVD